MRCAKCGRRIRGATWYCPGCGTPVDDLNVADSVHPRLAARTWVRLLAAALALFALAGVVALTGRLLRRADEARRTAAPTATAAPLATADAGATTSAPIETLVAAGAAGDGRYPDGAVDAPPGVATATPTAAATATPGAPATRDARAAEPAAELPPDDAPAAPPTVRSRPDAPVWTVARAGGTLQMDGWLDDWTVDPQPIAAIVFGREAWSGADDLSAAARLAWDAQMLYLGVEVTDDAFRQPAGGRELHLGDSLELQLDADLAGDFDDGSIGPDDWQLGISPGNLADRRPEVYAWRPLGAPLAGVRLGARETDRGYILEAALPWAALGVNPQAVDAIGASLNVSDNDGEGAVQESLAASSPRRAWDDPRTWGTWVLAR